MKTKKPKNNLILAGMRVPLPKQGEKVILPKTIYRPRNAGRRSEDVWLQWYRSRAS